MIEPGTLLQNRYRVVKQVGQGGMGAVYVATDERFNSTVAIKRTFFDDPALRKAFEREAHLLNHLRHAALPKVSDHFTEGDEQFLVMEFIEGSDLSELMKERRAAFPLADVLRWADELLDALDYLHTHEPPVIHRDIKPQNLKLTTRNQIVLLDFGLAKGMPAQTHASAPASVFGYSPNFAPLEQMQAAGTDPRSDLYSLGATLYFLMTGALPVDALTRAAATVKNQPDPLRPAHTAHAQVPASVGTIIQRAMAQNSALRPPTAAAMRASLRQASKALPAVALQARQTPRAHATTVFGQERSALDEATMVEPSEQSPGRRQAAPQRAARHTPPQLQPTLLPQHGEMSVADDDNTRRARSSEDSYTAVARRAPATPAASVSPTKILAGTIAVLLLACAVAASVLLVRRSGAAPANSEVKTEAVTGTQADTLAGAPAATQPASTAGAASNNSYAAEASSASTQTTGARPTDQAPAANAQSAPGAAEAMRLAEANAGGNSAASDASGRTSPSDAAAADKSALVIHNPAPAERRAPEEDSAVRPAEEFQGGQPRPRPEEGYRPPPPEGRRPPPPDGRRPPPRRPPPYR